MNNLADDLRSRNLANFMGHLADMRDKMKGYNEKITNTQKEADRVIVGMEASHAEKDRTKWEPADQRAYAEAQAARAQSTAHRAAFDGLSNDMRTLLGAESLTDSRAFGANTGWFRNHLSGMQGRLAALGAALGRPSGTGTTGSAGGPAAGGGSNFAGPQTFRIENDTKDVWVFVGGSYLRPGEKRDMTGSSVTMRAMGVTKTRDFVMHKKAVGKVQINVQTPYEFDFTVDSGGGTGHTTWRSRDEKYEWHASGSGKQQPAYRTATTKMPGDTVTLAIPTV